MQIKGIIKAIGVIIGAIVLLVAGTMVFVGMRSGQSQKRAEKFCNKVEINADLTSLENILSADSPDLIHILSSDGTPVGAFKDYRKLNLSEMNKSATSLLVIFQTGTPAFSACEVLFADKKILSKKIVNHN